MSFTYDGDPILAFQWLPFAKTQQLSMSRIGSNGGNLTPANGVMIMIRTNPNHIHIIAVGGGVYFFISYDGSSYIINSGNPPQSSIENGSAVSDAVQLTEAKVLSLASPDSNRNSWYQKTTTGTITVLAGFGTRYITNRPPHTLMGGGSLGLGYLELYIDGKQTISTIAALNGFYREEVLVGVNLDGGIEYEFNDIKYTASSLLPAPTAPPSTAFIQIIKATSYYPSYPYEYDYNSHSISAGWGLHACYWSINQDATKAVGVSYIAYDVAYDAREIATGDPDPSKNITRQEFIPYLIEIDINIVFTEGVPNVYFSLDQQTVMDFESSKQFLIAADFYYYGPKDPDFQQSYEPNKDELIMLLSEQFNYQIDNRLDGGNYIESVDNSLIIKSRTTTYIEDKFNYNVDTGLNSDPNFANHFSGRVKSVDLRSMAYSTITTRVSNKIGQTFCACKSVFRGSERLNHFISEKELATQNNITEQVNPAILEDNNSNWYTGFWSFFDLDGKLAANPFDDKQFSYNRYAGYTFDLYTLYYDTEEVSEYKRLFNYHFNSKAVNSDDKITANTWII